MPADVRQAKSSLIVEQILRNTLYQKSKLLFSFVPFDHEIDLRSLLEQALADGKQVAIPLADMKNKQMTLYYFERWDQLQPGVYGILEPDPLRSKQVDPSEIDLIVMPGVGFDRKGGRIGYGGGFYDRFLAKLDPRPPLLAPCFSEQLMEEAPMEEHDFRVDLIITEQETIICKK
ncbi:5-formyltetrahydrofolate cyclo-ligase [Ammoniphilus oxalaticus]|uniref:5-formyltetrahydrofolate cyclo-ligase n=2 Tax=Ammoniphilus oxalaticus TaxID=66863 RepID=A0A419SHD9_9BACL|nr:5-formyltetrahydrofolate cyclo-ligase [Ammoniphilus oxalaticus]